MIILSMFIYIFVGAIIFGELIKFFNGNFLSDEINIVFNVYRVVMITAQILLSFLKITSEWVPLILGFMLTAVWASIDVANYIQYEMAMSNEVYEIVLEEISKKEDE